MQLRSLTRTRRAGEMGVEEADSLLVCCRYRGLYLKKYPAMNGKMDRGVGRV